MKYSVFTPTNNSRWLKRAYESLLAQTTQDWEWILVPNHGLNLPELSDPRIKVCPFESENIGALKNYACSQATGTWLVELDHDDELLPTCLEEIGKSSADFVYSNLVMVMVDGSPGFFDSSFGWEYREFQGLAEVLAPAYVPSNLSQLAYAPDHVRAWRRNFYWSIGGHADWLQAVDDHDLVCRSVLWGTVQHIDKPLYVYHMHPNNSSEALADVIEERKWEVHGQYVWPLFEKWSEAEGLQVVNLYTDDLSNFVDQRVGLIQAHDAVQLHADPIELMNEAHRVLAHGGLFDILVPSTKGEGAWCDPRHKSFWNARSFKYYIDPGMRVHLEPQCTAKFQLLRLHEEELFDDIPYVRAELLALHDGPRLHGENLWL